MYCISKLPALVAILGMNAVPFTYRKLHDGWQLEFPWTEGDVACHEGTYYWMETYQFPWDNGDCTRFNDASKLGERLVTAYYQAENG